MTLKKGYAYLAKEEFKDNYYHPIVILDDTPGQIIACVLSSKEAPQNSVTKNILLSEEHIADGYTLKYKPSYLIKVKFHKVESKINPEVHGKITDEGMVFIEEELKNMNPEVLDGPIWKRKIANN